VDVFRIRQEPGPAGDGVVVDEDDQLLSDLLNLSQVDLGRLDELPTSAFSRWVQRVRQDDEFPDSENMSFQSQI
jgi:hypothetical protein